ncbi:hypothetical protein PPL_04459 [Heterostelium album PN500]|uniref:Uncharacterized protein n=1 Tax=Heterostelium pallidum (strain ATCC 26659 / Pp 5 / PN500) TaxID=670386 RepID=D3B7M1_HETP5|nr:hypothetical protein PPL_04459 [Heterostelium album PN500]EFA82764.1 hypothetical protein PPL_04459 [Heterostelium album PN500]|eukprot:XP_020434881.1 hypothetical protein PPL_04459 [Heterostelium album PN500]
MDHQNQNNSNDEIEIQNLGSSVPYTEPSTSSIDNSFDNDQKNSSDVQIVKKDDYKPKLKDEVPKHSRFNPKFYTEDHINETRLILMSMFFKFAFETLSPALGLYVLTKFDSYGVTLLAVMNIVYFLMQSVGSIMVGPFIRKFRASRVTSIVFLFMFAVISFIILLEAGYKGTRTELGGWDKWLITVVYIVMGLSLGMIEVSRKLIPRQILGNDNDALSKMNGLVHVFYEVSGTSGAFLSTPLIKFFGPIYSMFLMPPFFLVASIIAFTITEPFPAVKEISNEPKPKHNALVGILISIKEESLNYCKTVGRGARYILTKDYWWVIPTYVIPQVLHRILENVLFSVFAKKILHDGSLSGILTGGSNFGELCGALAVVKFGKYVKNPMWWVRVDGLCCSIVWVLVYPPSGVPIHVAATLIPCWIFVSSSWAAGDVSILSFLQSSFPLNVNANDNFEAAARQDRLEEIALDKEDLSEADDIDKEIDEEMGDKKGSGKMVKKDDDVADEDDPPTGSPLASVLGFLFTTYAVIISLLSFGLGRVMDNFAAQGDIHQGFFWIAGVGFSAAGFIAIISSFFAKSPKFQ